LANNDQNEKSIANLLDKLANLSENEINEGEFVLLTNQLLDLEEYVLYSLTKTLVQKYRNTGILKSYKISELQEYFEWEKTQLNYYLNQAIKQNILLYAKRKYSLNLDNILVKRVWNYYFTITKNESLSSTEMIEITSIMKRKRLIEIQMRSLNKLKENDDQIHNNSDFTHLINEIRKIMSDSYDPKDDLVNLCNEILPKLI